MIAFGIIAFFQVVFIPGFIFLNFFQLKGLNWLEIIIYSFGLSLIINYLIVYHLTLFKIYLSLTSYILLVAELILSIYLVLKKNINFNDKRSLRSFLLPLKYRSFPYNLPLLLSLMAIAGFLYFFFSNLNKVLTGWDAVFSWNRWAIDWSMNQIPFRTYLYPQLIPANWSLTYVMMQNHQIQLFAGAIMPLFAIFTLFIFLSFYHRKRDRSWLFSLLIFLALILTYSLPYITSGYVDFAVGYFSFLTFYAIVTFEPGNSGNFCLKKILIVFTFATGAAATKQAGFIVLIFAITWITWYLIKYHKNISLKLKLITVFGSLLLISFNLYWYIVKLVEIYRGVDYSMLQFLLEDIHNDLNYLQRFINGLENLRFNPAFFIVIALISLSGFLSGKSRWFTLGLTIPAIVIWGIFFSYDDRNIVFAFPFIAYSASFGLSALFDRFFRNRLKGKNKLFFKQKKIKTGKISVNRNRIFFIFFTLVMTFIFISIPFNEKVAASQIEKQKQNGLPSLNKLIYEYKDEKGIDGKIITDYYWITAIPGFEDKNMKIFKENENFIILSNSDSYELVDPNSLVDDKTFGFLISERYFKNSEFFDQFQKNLEEGSCELIFERQDFYFIRIVRE